MVRQDWVPHRSSSVGTEYSFSSTKGGHMWMLGATARPSRGYFRHPGSFTQQFVQAMATGARIVWYQSPKPSMLDSGSIGSDSGPQVNPSRDPSFRPPSCGPTVARRCANAVATRPSSWQRRSSISQLGLWEIDIY